MASAPPRTTMIVRPNSSGAPQTGISGRPTGLPASPPRDYWCDFGVGRTGFIHAKTAEARGRKVCIEIYLNHLLAKRAFDLLVPTNERPTLTRLRRNAGILLDDKKACRIAVYR